MRGIYACPQCGTIYDPTYGGCPNGCVIKRRWFLVLVAPILALALAIIPAGVVVAGVVADPPDCNDPSDNGPLVPGDCGYVQPGGFQGDYSIYLPLMFGPVQTSQVSLQMFRDANGDGSFNAGEWPASWTRKRMYITADESLVLAPALDATGGTLSSFTYVVGTQLSIAAEESESAAACPIWSGVMAAVVPAWDVTILVPMAETGGCR